jgi:hypothetical protein
MTNEQIEKFISTKLAKPTPVQINFKTRSSIQGIFIQLPDYAELKSKNLWRIVGESRIQEFKTSKDVNLARIFNGTEITKLVVVA